MNISNDLQFIQQALGENQVSGVERQSSASAVSHSSRATDAGDQAHLSPAASLASQAASLPDVRMEKVQSIQGAIAEGSYHVSSTDLAHSLIGHMLTR